MQTRDHVDHQLSEDSLEMELCFEDWLHLHRQFASVCDLSRAQQMARQVTENPNAFKSQWLGSGTHFEAYRLDTFDARCSLALKVSNQGFPHGQRTMAEFEQCLMKVRGITEPSLTPPIEFFRTQDDRLAILMPYGSSASIEAARHWQPLQIWIDHTLKLYDKLGIILDDMVQIRSWRGTPFIIDLSDLRLRHR